MRYLATSFFLDETRYPGVRASGRPRAEIYWRCMAVMFASVRRWNPDSDLELIAYSSVDPPADLRALIDGLEVRIEAPPFRSRPPAGYAEHYGASVYSIDALAHLAGHIMSAGDSVLILDPDCVCVAPAADAFSTLDRLGVLSYQLGYGPGEKVHGMDDSERSALFTEMAGRELPGSPVIGSELLGFTASTAADCAVSAADAWGESLERWRHGKSRFPNEEFLFSYLFLRDGAPIGSANPFIRRVWTLPTLRNASPADLDLDFWHLPAEKTRGIPRLLAAAQDRDGWFWNAPRKEWLPKAAGIVGITRSPGRLAYDLGYRGLRRLARIARLRRPS